MSVEPFDCGTDAGAAAAAAPPPSSRCSTARAKGDFQQIELSADVVAAGVDEGRHPRAHPRRRRRGRRRRYGFFDYARGTPIVVLAIALRRRRRRWSPGCAGSPSLLGLGFAFFILFRFVLPGLLAEESPTLVSLVGSSAIMFVVLYLAHGFSARTTTALVGTLFGLDAGGRPRVGRGVAPPGSPA